MMICDICSAENPTKEIPCIDFTMEQFSYKSISSFAVCEQCETIINRNDLEALFEWGKSTYILKYREWHPALDDALRKFYRRFLENRIRVEGFTDVKE